jgi:integrase
VARKLSVYPDLRQVTMEDVRALADDWRSRERACGRALNTAFTRQRYMRLAAAWLRFLGHLKVPEEPIPFHAQLQQYCQWARDERGLTEATVRQFYSQIKHFLCWYGVFERDLADVQVGDVDAYLARGSARGWCRITVNNVAVGLRAFFRYCSQRQWTRAHLADGIQGPRIYALEGLPTGPDWSDVQRLFASLDVKTPMHVRDRPILMLFAIYGLRAIEVAGLCLEHLDWERGRLHVPRAKRRETQVYPLLPSVRDALVRYLRKVRRPSVHREVFLTLRPPFQPISTSGLYNVAAKRLKALGVRTAHHGPHSLRHACAARLVAGGLSLKEIGDHLGHRSASATRTYAKVDLRALREVAAFDAGELL